MREILRILCPIDRSEPSRLALDYAARLAAGLGSQLTVLEVLDLATPVLPTGAGGPKLEPGFRQSLTDALDALVAPVRESGVEIETRLAEGHVVSEIIRAAAELPADLVVAGTHGRSGFERFLLGSTAEKLLRKAICPTLTVPPGARPAASPPFRRVLCATDFSEASQDALAYAVRFARDAQGEVLVVHALEWPLGSVPEGDDAVSRLHRSLEEEARSQLAEAIRAADAGEVRCEPIVRTGRPRQVVAELAASRDVDLICVGATGRGAVPATVLGSTTSHIVQSAECPVLTVPPRRQRGG